MLRHSSIAITAEHYLDQKEHVTIGLGNLLVLLENVTPILANSRTSAAGRKRISK
jgi:hypothetical protein